ncbi:hypothetical protein [Roseovarius atlanticus]|uniref:hypothetical protein n=1 Tax=Roseovarius atlanticus TaxID=1641875 RepID=UPI001C980A9A|nr:hypothetical protein [Roseovarius atlanticus]MBY5988712.1 hypothetical protein [Roseovarius atlanticus]MBY6124103.1 hypothetical protein [Roseovarius atlanticus]MBY6148598.1 hypothetical protein [Roseovarius atlanticus]
MADKDHKKWIDILSMGTSVPADDSGGAFDPPESFLLLPEVQTAPEDLACDAFDFKTSGSDGKAAFDIADVLVSSYQTGGSGTDDRDAVPEPEPIPEFATADHFDFF